MGRTPTRSTISRTRDEPSLAATPGTDDPAQRMADDDDVVETRLVDVGDDRVDPVGDGDRSQIARLVASPAGQVDGQAPLRSGA